VPDPDSSRTPFDFTPPSAADIKLPDQIAGYRIQRLLGSGGMAAVYAALQKQPRRTVALKVMKSAVASDVAVRRFKREIEILGKLHHPFIAQVYDAGIHDDGTGAVPFLVMEYVANARTILEFAAQHDLSVNDRLKLFVKVCAAVEHGHQHKIIHRDLKPANILVESHGDPKVIDFGVAHAAQADLTSQTLHTTTGQLVGTLQYMSPEQVDPKQRDLTPRCDVYALGVILYRMLTGKLPHDLDALPVFEAARIIREVSPRTPSQLKPELKGDLETIILKAMDREPSRRYTTAGSLGRDIVRFLAHKPINARRASVAYRTRLFLRRQWRAVAVASLVLACLAAVVVVSIQRNNASSNSSVGWVSESRPEAETSVAHQSSNLTSTQPEAASDEQDAQRRSEKDAGPAFRISKPFQLPIADISGLALNSAGSLAAIASADHSLLLFNLATRKPVADPINLESPITRIAWSPEGSALAAATADGSLWIIDPAAPGLPGADVISDDWSLISAIAFAPAADSVAIATDDLSIHILNNEGEPRRTLRSTTGRFTCLALDSTGDLLAAGTDTGEVLCWSASTGDIVNRLVNLGSEVLAVTFADDAASLAAVTRAGAVVRWSLDQSIAPRTHDFASGPLAAAFSADANFLALATADDELLIWNVSDWQPHANAIPLDESPIALAIAPKGSTVILALPASRLQLIRLTP